MNIKEANTEAFASYRKAHIDLNVTTKVALGCFEEINTLVAKDKTGKLLGRMVDNLKMPWGKGKTFPSGPKIIEKASENYIYNSFVQIVGNFEFFLTHLVSDVCHFSSYKDPGKTYHHAHLNAYQAKNPPIFPQCCMAYAEQLNSNYPLIPRIDKIKIDLGVTDPNFDKLLPLFNFLWLVRNSVIHLEGMATKDLCDFYIDPKNNLQTSFNFWNTTFARNKSPLLPVPVRGKKIILEASQTILASAVCFELAKILNNNAISILGEKGIINMAVYFGLIQLDHDYRNAKCSNSPEGVVAMYLSDRYHVMEVKGPAVLALLKHHGYFEIARDRFKLYSNKC